MGQRSRQRPPRGEEQIECSAHDNDRQVWVLWVVLMAILPYILPRRWLMCDEWGEMEVIQEAFLESRLPWGWRTAFRLVVSSLLSTLELVASSALLASNTRLLQ